MPRKNAPEFSYDEKTGLYCKKIKDPSTGKWMKIYGHTKDELRQKRKQREEDLAAAAAAVDAPFVYQYAARWYELHSGDVGTKRQQDYKNAINNHICPIIGSMQMRAVTSDDIGRVMAACAGLSKSSQQKIVTTLKRIFYSAEGAGLIPHDPCRKLKAGGAPSAEKTPLTKTQQQTLLAAVDGTTAGSFVALCLYTGLRREEALGLQWDCVHLDDAPPYLEVRRALRWEQNQPQLNEKLKSKSARRDIPLPVPLVEVLRAEKVKAKGDFVIADTKGEAMSAISFRRRVLDPIANRTVRTVEYTDADGKPQTRELKVGDRIRNHDMKISIDFKVTPHILRHTYITELIMAGADIKTVQYLAGHQNVQLTLNIYTHLMGHQPSDTISAVQKAFS